MQPCSFPWDAAFTDRVSLPQTTETRAYLKASQSPGQHQKIILENFSSATEALQEELFFF